MMITHKPNKLLLTPRLVLAASFVRDGARVADIGTDHAYLPVSLVLENKISSAIAADINEGPLKSAAATVEKYGLQNQITLVLSDGLKDISADACDDIVIAGMGGELIVSIIEKASWLKDRQKHLVLQPMTMQDVLRKYLFATGFTIIKEHAIHEGSRPYTVLSVQYTGEITNATPIMVYAGGLADTMDSEVVFYLQKEINKLKNKLKRYVQDENNEDLLFISSAKNQLELLITQYQHKEPQI